MSTETPAVSGQRWAGPVHRLASGPAGGIGLDGRRLTSPVQGFGRLWQKTYRVRLGRDVTPEQVMATWKQRFPEFWPANAEWISAPGIVPGQLAALRVHSPGGLTVTTGVLVLYADDTCFTVMTPEGHSFAGFNTFSAHRDGEETIAQVQALMRTSDPLFDLGMPIMHRMEDRQWRHTLTTLAVAHGVEEPEITLERILVDSRRQWRYWRNVRRNGLAGSLTRPFRSVFRRGREQRPSTAVPAG